METRSRTTRLALEFITAAWCGYLSYVEAKNGNTTLSTAYTFVSGFLSLDIMNNAAKIAYGNTRFIPLLNRFKRTSEPIQETLDRKDFEIVPEDDFLILEDNPVKMKPWDDDDLVPG